MQLTLAKAVDPQKKVKRMVVNKGLAEANYLVTRTEGYTTKDIEHEMNISVKTLGDQEKWTQLFMRHIEKIRKRNKK